ncbi:MAG: aldo/keto reductase family protein [Terracidiphilus sp.]
MRKRRLGKSALEVSDLSFGTWLTIAGGIERRQAIRCVQTAFESGVNLFDTANQYGAGEAERIVGEALRSYPRDNYLIATKLFFPVGDDPGHGLSAAQIEKQLNNSLQRLRLDSIDLYQCHRYDAETPLEETLTALDRAVRSGKVRAIGFSEWSAEQIQSAVTLIGTEHLTPFASNQSQYSIVWRKPEAAVLELGARNGIGFLAFSPLAHGVLTGKYKAGAQPPPGSRAADARMNMFMETAGRHYRSDYLLEAVALLKPIAVNLGLTMAQMSLAWLLKRPEVSSVIFGASRPEQIADNVKAVGAELPSEALKAINGIVQDVAVWK